MGVGRLVLFIFILFFISARKEIELWKKEQGLQGKLVQVVSCCCVCQRYSSVCSVTFCASVCKLHAKRKLTCSFEASLIGCVRLSLNNYYITESFQFYSSLFASLK